MVAVKKDLYIEQGTTFILPFQWRAKLVVDGVVTAGPPKDLTGWEFRMQVRQNQQSPALVSLSSATPTTNGSKIVLGADPNDPLTDPDLGGTPDPTNGWVRVIITDDDTDLMDRKTARYDLEAEDPDTTYVHRLLQGGVTVDPNITQETTDPVVT